MIQSFSNYVKTQYMYMVIDSNNLSLMQLLTGEKQTMKSIITLLSDKDGKKMPWVLVYHEMSFLYTTLSHILIYPYIHNPEYIFGI